MTRCLSSAHKYKTTKAFTKKEPSIKLLTRMTGSDMENNKINKTKMIERKELLLAFLSAREKSEVKYAIKPIKPNAPPSEIY